MPNAGQFYTALPDGNGGCTLLPRGAAARAVARLQGARFWDEAMPMTPAPAGTAMNNLHPNIPTPQLDPDLKKMMRTASSADRKRIYKAQRLRDRRRGFDASGCDCTRDQGPSPTKVVKGITSGVNRVSEFGGEVNRDEQLPHAESDGDEGVQVLGTLPPLEPGLTYSLYQEGDEVVLVSEPDDGDPPNTNDRMMKHFTGGHGTKDKVLVSMNRIMRGQHARSQWRDGNVENTLIRHRPLKGERLELRGPNEWGSWELVLISWAPGEHMIINPKGSQELDESDEGESSAASWLPQPEESDPLQLQQPNPTFRDGYRLSDTYQLRNMNARNRAFWAKR
jgi:hypothetical protein